MALVGEGDFTVVDLVNKIINNQDIFKIPGLLRQVSRGKYHNNPSDRLINLDNLPIPARHLVNMEGYFLTLEHFHSAKSRSNRVLNIMCSRVAQKNVHFGRNSSNVGIECKMEKNGRYNVGN